jgi:glycosyltransferase involved in cell wall biosynthesis
VTDLLDEFDLADEVDNASDVPHVVMMAGNNFLVDTRALKSAVSVAQWKLRVTAIGLAERGVRGERQIGDVRLLSPAIPPRALVTGLRYRLSALRPWFTSQAEYKRALGRWEYGTRELRGDRGRDARMRMRNGAQPQSPAGFQLGRAARWRLLRLRRVLLAVRAAPLRRARRGNEGIGSGRQLLLTTYRRLSLARWRRILPEIIDQDLVIGRMLDRLRPDVIHVHDVFMLGIAARAAHRFALEGRDVKIIYDAHEYLPGIAVIAPRRIAAYCDLEKEFIHDADRVVTVSEPLAQWLQRDHGLNRLPDVVLNAPVEAPTDTVTSTVRELADLPPDAPLLVYVGGVNRARGINTVVRALPALPGIHVVVVARGNSVTRELQQLAERLGVGDRFHLAPYVDPELVPSYIRPATVGISPLLRAPNHDIAVTNKFCEYIAAGLPIVTSDTPAQAELVRDLDLGAVHVAGDVDDCARAIRAVLADRDRLARRISSDAELRHRFSWAAQAETLRTVYDELLGKLPEQAWASDATRVDRLVSNGGEEDA